MTEGAVDSHFPLASTQLRCRVPPQVKLPFFVSSRRVEPLSHTVQGPEGEAHLPPKAMQLLVCLARLSNRVVTKHQLLDEVWTDTVVGEEVLTNAVWQIRQAFGENARHSQIIETVSGQGYRLRGKVRFEDPRVDPRRAVAVLPLDDLSGKPEQDYFPRGITGGLINALAQCRALRVVGRTSVMPFVGTPLPLDRIGWELGVEYIATGTVLRAGNRVRVEVELSEVRRGSVLWAERFDRDLSELQDLQQEIARAITQQVAAEGFECDEAPSAGTPEAVDKATYDRYLQGCFLLDGTDFSSIQEGISLLIQGHSEEGVFAPAAAAAARGYYLLASWGRAPGIDLLPKAEQAAESAMGLDPGLVEARVWWIMARLVGNWAPAEAREELLELLAKAPHHGTARDALARCEAALGNLDKAIEAERLALASDPLSPALGTALAFFHRLAGHHDYAIDLLERLNRRHSAWRTIDLELGRTHLQLGRKREAAEVFLRAEPSWGRFLLDIVDENQKAVQSQLDGWEACHPAEYVAPYWMAERCLWAGRRDLSLDWLERAVDDRQLHAVFMAVEPSFEPLRDEPRFRQLLRRMGISPACPPA